MSEAAAVAGAGQPSNGTLRQSVYRKTAATSTTSVATPQTAACICRTGLFPPYFSRQRRCPLAIPMTAQRYPSKTTAMHCMSTPPHTSPSRIFRGAKVYGAMTTAMHDYLIHTTKNGAWT